jgi:hypothetical protein
VGTLRLKLAVVVAVLGAVAVAAVAIAHDRGAFKAQLAGFTEVPAVITNGNGRFEARISRTSQEIQWTLHYQQTNATVTQAHIHVGQAFVAAGISVWLCANNPPITAAPPGTQACPNPTGDISGTITPANVVGPEAQGVKAGDFDALVRAMRSGLTYANVHTTQSPGGEIRGQIGSKGSGRD